MNYTRNWLKGNPESYGSFPLPGRFLSPAKRQAMQSLSSFCQEAEAAGSRQQLMTLRAAIFNIYGNPALSSSDPLRGIIAQYGLRRDYFDAILDGAEMDLGAEMLRPKIETLSLYCYRTACCAALLSIAILGESGPSAEKFAIALGHAVKLTCVLRDVEQDAQNGRIYLPLEWLSAEAIADIAPGELQHHAEAVQRVCSKLAELAERYFIETEALSLLCNRRRLLPLLLMRDIYQQMFLEKNFRVGFFSRLGIVAGAVRYLFSQR